MLKTLKLSLPFSSHNTDLNRITATIDSEFKAFKKTYKQSMKTNVFLINRISGYMTSRYGKMLRPKLVLLSAKLFGPINEQTIASAVLIELLHVATLLHDDVVDRAEQRRGIPSIHSIWKNKTAVLMGDFLFSRALINLVGLRNFDSLDVLSMAAERMSKGELLQLEKNRSNGLDEETYFRMISDKTASLFSAACEMGALTSTESTDRRKSLSLFGEHLGIAFQLKDDLFDFTGKKANTGKPVGRDVKENLITLPVIHSLANDSKRSARKIIKNLRNKNGKSDFQMAVNYVKERGGLEYTEHKLNFHSQKAIEFLSDIEESDTKEALIKFVRFNIDRTR